MEMTKLLVFCALVVIVMTEVILARPPTNMEALVKDIDDRLIRNEKTTSRRRRRHLETQQIALMEFCLRFVHRCRHEMARLRRLRNERRGFRVIVIEK